MIGPRLCTRESMSDLHEEGDFTNLYVKCFPSTYREQLGWPSQAKSQF